LIPAGIILKVNPALEQRGIISNGVNIQAGVLFKSEILPVGGEK